MTAIFSVLVTEHEEHFFTVDPDVVEMHRWSVEDKVRHLGGVLLEGPPHRREIVGPWARTPGAFYDYPALPKWETM